MSINLQEIYKDFKPEDIVSAYSGKQGCACGCNGKYYTHSKNVELNRKITGWDGGKVNDSHLAYILKMIQIHSVDDLEFGSNYIAFNYKTVGGTEKAYRIYPACVAERY